MAEWFKAAVLKTASLKGDVGSNPTPSAKFCIAKFGEISPFFYKMADPPESLPRNFTTTFGL